MGCRTCLYLCCRAGCANYWNKRKYIKWRRKTRTKAGRRISKYECLAGRGFEYAHNSYIVNLAKVEGLEKNVALLPFGIQLNVSRSRKGQFADALITFLGERNGMV